MNYAEALKHPDSIAFLVVQGLVVLVAAYSFLRQAWTRLFARGIPGEVTRGEKSWGRFLVLHGLLLMLVFQLIGVAEITAGYRVLICLGNFALATYLTLGNGWFRNWSLGWMRRVQERPER